MVGIIQEQHPERCRLFMQWKRMGWPILVDALDQLEVSVVPITLAIDEHGVIRRRLRRPDVARLESEFLSKTFDATPSAGGSAAGKPDPRALRKKAESSKTTAAWRAYGETLAVWGGDDRLDDAVRALEKAAALDPEEGWTQFRLGVAHRLRFDSASRKPSDFQKAIDHWARALEIDPNNYIWRRRIQQYGPRLIKPYPFYDWVDRAREAIRGRGEEPIELAIEPGGAEFARPAKTFETAAIRKEEPDPQGKIIRDAKRMILTETTVVPPSIKAGQAARVHVVFRPNTRLKAHWNNERGESAVWMSPLEGWKIDDRHHALPSARQPTSAELRTVEFEIRCPESASPGKVRIPAYALYYICEDEAGKCLYRRQDLSIELTVVK